VAGGFQWAWRTIISHEGSKLTLPGVAGESAIMTAYARHAWNYKTISYEMVYQQLPLVLSRILISNFNQSSNFTWKDQRWKITLLLC
jgi:hypothetical protein